MATQQRNAQHDKSAQDLRPQILCLFDAHRTRLVIVPENKLEHVSLASLDMQSTKEPLRQRLESFREPPRNALGHLLGGGIHVGLAVLCVLTWNSVWWPSCILFWLILAWLDHAALARLHEATHRMLFGSRILNELTGMLIGTLSLIPHSVYRYVHTQHHAHLGGIKDPEFWPYNLPGSSRLLRLTYAWLEVLFGWIFTPVLYSLRTAYAWRDLNTNLRTKLVFEWLFLIGFWTVVLSVVAYTDTWQWFLVGHFVPAWLAGTLQTIRKFTEHLGRSGDNIYEMTRTVVYRKPIGKLASTSQLHVEHHGTHHRWPRIPWHRLPEATEVVYDSPEPGLVYPNHLVAILDMMPHLLDPKLGPQWAEHLKTQIEAKPSG